MNTNVLGKYHIKMYTHMHIFTLTYINIFIFIYMRENIAEIASKI